MIEETVDNYPCKYIYIKYTKGVEVNQSTFNNMKHDLDGCEIYTNYKRDSFIDLKILAWIGIILLVGVLYTVLHLVTVCVK